MKFYIYTLGCKVNSYESNVMRDKLLNHGYIEGNENDSDIYIINTCTVTNTSDNKSLKTIRHVINNNKNSIVIAVGCMTQVNYKLLESLNVSIVLGNSGKSKIVDYIEKYKKNRKPIIDVENIMEKGFEDMCLNNFNKTRAYVKIEDGCENYCSYCIIPYSRGKVRSKDPNVVISEITNLVNDGHKEIVLTGIHTGHYGSEFKDYDFADLLSELVKIDGLLRLRISSIEIVELNDKFLEVLKNNKVLVDHLHIPLQSGSDPILKAMNRRYNLEYYENKIKEIRKIRPNISISTDVIVGLPGETKELFEETIATVKRLQFSKIHVFPYSRRKGTKADLMPNQVDEHEKKERARILIEVSKELEIAYMTKFINAEVSFIAETYVDGYIFGHTGNYLAIKMLNCENVLKKNIQAKITKIEYPYCIAE